MAIPQVLDCTIRDGGYLNGWRFDPHIVRAVYRAASKSGIDYVELGYHGNPRHFALDSYGLWRFSPETALRGVTAGIEGAQIALMVDVGKYDPSDILPKTESIVDLIRVAVHRDKVEQAVAEALHLKAKGYQVSVQLMGYAAYSRTERRELRQILHEAPLDYVYIGDSYGSILPVQIEAFLEDLRVAGSFKLGFHPHNHLQMGFANVLEAMRLGIDIIDATIYGMGRAAGNLPLEVLVAYLQSICPDRFNVVPLLNIIDPYFLDLYRQSPWGYQLPFMISGMFNIHPNYAEDLISRREYTIEDIWKALLVIKQKNPIGFSKALVDEIIEAGFVGKPATEFPKEFGADVVEACVAPIPPQVTYVDRHRGRDFLVLANGPSVRRYVSQIKEFIQKHNPVVLGANYLGNLFTPHYHAFNNKRRFVEYIQTVSPESKLLLGTNFDEGFIAEYTNRDFELLHFLNRRTTFAIEDGVITTDCRTISVLLCAVSVVMGAKRIFVAGMDGYFGPDNTGQVHFYPEKDETFSVTVIRDKHMGNYHYLKQINAYLEVQGMESIHILTPTAYTEFYKGISNYC